MWQLERALVSKLLVDGPQHEHALRALGVFVPPFWLQHNSEPKVGACLGFDAPGRMPCVAWNRAPGQCGLQLVAPPAAALCPR